MFLPFRGSHWRRVFRRPVPAMRSQTARVSLSRHFNNLADLADLEGGIDVCALLDFDRDPRTCEVFEARLLHSIGTGPGTGFTNVKRPSLPLDWLRFSEVPTLVRVTFASGIAAPELSVTSQRSRRRWMRARAQA